MAQTISVRKNILLSGDKPATPHIEPFIVMDTSQGLQFLSCAVTFDSTGNMVSNLFISSDTGKTWSRKDCFIQSSGDPWVTVSESGWYFSCLGKTKEGKAPVLVYHSTDFGNTWSAPTGIPFGDGNSFDRPMIISGYSAKGKERIFLIASQSFSNKNSPMLIAPVYTWSDDNGKSFHTPNIISTGNLWANAFNPVSASNNKIIIPFIEYAENGEMLKTKKAWSVIFNNLVDSLSSQNLIADYAHPSYPWSLAIDNSNGKNKNRIYLVSTEISESKKNVVVAYSQDEGKSWSTPVKINDSILKTDFYATPAIAVNSKGVVGVVWYDKSKSENCWALYFSASSDGGKTFLPNVLVSEEVGCPDSAKNIVKQLDGNSIDVSFRWQSGGDYIGLCSSPDGAFHVMWSDARTGFYQLYYSQININ